ncbi:hypothetical protein [Parerythrobacter aestuarii]|uniref:hypothetical protein n=1 Tax=Parerythrobacter aestuarii TaxID=3020909 RepID=UPI0024DEED1C|nr:hypothetical protein [Parerythrobacter aestuarii]
MIRVAQLLIVMLIFALSPLRAQADEAEAPPACTVDTAVPATIAQLRTDEGWRFKCVVVEGILDGNTLHASREAMFGLDRPRSPETSYISLQRSPIPKASTPLRARVVGIADNCGKVQAEADEQTKRKNAESEGLLYITFIGGTCHYHSLPYIDPVAVTFLSFNGIERYTTDEVSADKTDLLELSPGDLATGIDLRLAQWLVAAIIEGNEAAFHAITNPENRPEAMAFDSTAPFVGLSIEPGEDGDPPRIVAGEFSKELFRRSLDQWAKARELSSWLETPLPLDHMPRKLFTLRDWESPGGEVISGPVDIAEVRACWCKKGDCSGKWPAFFGDADMVRDRPYFCIDLGMWTVFKRTELEPYAGLTESEYGMAEPVWPEEGQTE